MTVAASGLADHAPQVVPMHGLGGRQDLPLPFEFVVAGAAVAVLASFVLLAFAWRTPRPVPAGMPLPEAISRAIDSSGLRWSVRTVGLAIAVFMGLALVFGQDRLTNPIFGFVYVWIWVGLVPISLLFGPMWRTLNALRSLHLLGSRALGAEPHEGVVSLPVRIGIWPAAAGLFTFVWLELVAPDRATIPILLMWVALYVVILLVGAIAAGQAWFDASDPFETYALTMAKLSPWGRDDQRRIVVRSPLTNLATLPAVPGRVVFLAVLIGSTGYDGFSNATIWIGWAQNTPLAGIPIQTLGLLTFIAAVLGSYSLACMAAGHLGHSSRRTLPGLFAPSLVPIALGYVAAHYLTLLLWEGQRVLITASDPLGRGWNIFGTAEWGLALGFANHPGLIGMTQCAAIVAGHILGVITAHNKALELFDRPRALLGQIPLVLLMLGYTVGALLLLFAE